MLVELKPDLIADDVGAEILVCDPKSALVHRLDGDAAALVRSIRAVSQPLDCPMTAVLEGLVDAGIVVEHSSSRHGLVTSGRTTMGLTMSRRSMMGLGAVATAAGIVTLSLPDAVAAMSEPPNQPLVISSALDEDNEVFYFTGLQITSGSLGRRMGIYWEPVPASFTYRYEIRHQPSTTVVSTGLFLASNSFQEIPSYTPPRNTLISVTFTSFTTPRVTLQRSTSWG